MMRNHRLHVAYVFALILLHPTVPLSAGTVVQPGAQLVLDRDLILTGNDSLEIRGTAAKPTVLDGQYHRIRTKDKWTGTIKITHCRIQRLGSKDSYTPDRKRLLPDCEAILLHVFGKGEVVFEHCTFDQSNSVEITNHEQSATPSATTPSWATCSIRSIRPRSFRAVS